MTKVAFLVPKEEMVEHIRQLLPQENLDISTIKVVVDNNSALQEARNAVQAGAEIIVARGKHASVIQQDVSIPVVDLTLTGQEIALLIAKCKQQIPKPDLKIAIVSHKNLAGDTSHFGEAFSVSVYRYFFDRYEELHEIILQAVKDGIDIIIGGHFVINACLECKVPHMYISTTEDCIREAMEKTKLVARAVELEKKNAAQFLTLLDYSFNGIVKLDLQGRVVALNYIASKILDIDMMTTGISLSILIGAENAARILDRTTNGEEIYSMILQVRDIMLMANAAPIMVEEQIDGIILSFWELKKLAQLEAQARTSQYRAQNKALAHFSSFSAKSLPLKAAIKEAQLYAQSDNPLLLQGETGDDSMCFAQCIHNASPFSQGPFVSLLCQSGMSGGVTGQELSDAIFRADQGTLFLKGIDLLSPYEQRILVRLITEHLLEANQAESVRQVNVRIIAGTTEHLHQLSMKGLFDKNLLYLFSSLAVHIPPLRERGDDLRDFIDVLFREFSNRYSKYVVLTADAAKCIAQYPWPGNHLQLQSFIDRLVLAAPARTISEGFVKKQLELVYPVLHEIPSSNILVQYREPEAALLSELLERHRGNRAAIAAELGISKTTLWRKMNKYGLRG